MKRRAGDIHRRLKVREPFASAEGVAVTESRGLH